MTTSLPEPPVPNRGRAARRLAGEMVVPPAPTSLHPTNRYTLHRSGRIRG